jgi:hypothetical protein
MPRLKVIGGVATVLLLILSPAVVSAQDAVANGSATFGDADVDTAIAKVKADPNLSTDVKKKVLRWRSKESKESSPKGNSSLQWIGNLFRFLGQTGRVIVWLALAVAVGLLLVLLIRIVRGAGPPLRTTAFVAPTHVRDLDIRPESLPDDIGAAALKLWQQGETRAALALLYRGLLSRLVHVHAVPVKPSSTEGDCLAMAAQLLAAERAGFAGQLIRVWQRAVYGAQLPDDAVVQALCGGFASALVKDAPTATAAKTQ